MAMEKKRIMIVGGVAGGASCGARARRLSETAEIIIFDRGEYVSFANCGLPYYVGDVIRKEEDLLVATPGLFRERFNIEVRLKSEVIAIDRNRQTISVKDLRSGSVYEETYDALVLSPGASAIRQARIALIQAKQQLVSSRRTASDLRRQLDGGFPTETRALYAAQGQVDDLEAQVADLGSSITRAVIRALRSEW